VTSDTIGTGEANCNQEDEQVRMDFEAEIRGEGRVRVVIVVDMLCLYFVSVFRDVMLEDRLTGLLIRGGRFILEMLDGSDD
jgi:hypothetical protein